MQGYHHHHHHHHGVVLLLLLSAALLVDQSLSLSVPRNNIIYRINVPSSKVRKQRRGSSFISPPLHITNSLQRLTTVERKRDKVLLQNAAVEGSTFKEEADDDCHDDNDDDHDVEIITVPTMKRILEFAIPAIGVWLCSPLLSMIDTSTVGLLSGTAQQAALNPAVAVTDYSARTMSFLYIGTTNMIAISSQTQDKKKKKKKKMMIVGSKDDSIIDNDNENNNDKNHLSQTSKTFCGALQLAVWVGVTLGSILIVFARPMLSSLIGNDTMDPDIMNAAMKYVTIRALGMPAASFLGTAQAACLGMQDVHSPLLVIVAAAIMNLVLDLVLVRQRHVWLGGAAGAAWATMISQYFAAALFIKWLSSNSSQQRPNKKKNTILSDLTSRSKTQQQQRRSSSDDDHSVNSFSTKGFLVNQLNWRQLLTRRPNVDIWDGFKPYVVPVTTTQVGRCSAYIALGHTVSSCFGTVSMAANQIITSIFYALIPIADSLGLTAQTFLPAMIAMKPSHNRATILRRTSWNLFKVAGWYGLVLAGIVGCIPLVSRLFTTDPAVLAMVVQVVPILLIIFSLHGIFCGAEGILLAHKDLSFLGRMYAVYFAVVPFLMWRVKRAFLQGGVTTTVNLTTVWQVFLGYQLFRISIWVGRVAWLQRRSDKEAILASK